MRPITFACEVFLPLTPAQIAEQILDIANWTGFTGYGIIPGISSAEFETRTDEVVGSRIRVVNKDGSTHIEEITEWDVGHRLQLDMKEFSAPLSRLATGFEESWAFESQGGFTHVVRSIKIHPRIFLARPMIWLISFFLKRAIARHLLQIRDSVDK